MLQKLKNSNSCSNFVISLWVYTGYWRKKRPTVGAIGLGSVLVTESLYSSIV